MKVFHVFLKGLYVLVDGVRGHAADLEKNMRKNIFLKNISNLDESVVLDKYCVTG